MYDYLLEFCKNLDINIIYKNNNHTILSFSVNKCNPTNIVHNIIKNLTKKIALAIMIYFTEPEHKDTHLNILKNYMKEEFPYMKYKITPPNEIFKELCDKNITCISEGQEDKPSLVELNISNITVTDFYGNISNVNPTESINISENEFLEIEFIVDPITN
jgi:hypothetical protein